MRQLLVLLAAALAGAPPAAAQAVGDTTRPGGDTVRVALQAMAPTGGAASGVDLLGFTRLVRAHHPVARQARLAQRIAGAELLMARGALYDPVATAEWDRKRFEGSLYYDYVVAGVKIPTPFGVEVKLGYERTAPDGAYFNPDRRTPASGLLVAGISIPLARGILTDDRRTAVAQAKAMRDVATADRAAMVNKLLFAAVKDYAGWYEAERRRAIADTGVGLAAFRLQAIRQRVLNGDAAAIDTIEAGLELERRRVARAEAAAAARVARLGVSLYLWDEDGEPLDLAADAAPSLGPLDAERLDTTQADVWLAQALRFHPDVQKALGKLRAAEAARRLFRQELLPDARLELSAIGDDETTAPFSGWPSTDENYKVGLKAKSALLLMKERGKYDASRFKAQIAGLETELTSRTIRAEVLGAIVDVVAFESILERQREAVRYAGLLRDGEVRRFDAGESTLFLVNARERTLLDEQLKLASFEAKYAGARAALAFALGQPGDLATP